VSVSVEHLDLHGSLRHQWASTSPTELEWAPRFGAAPTPRSSPPGGGHITPPDGGHVLAPGQREHCGWQEGRSRSTPYRAVQRCPRDKG
jgi:hypothetical protein